MVKYSRFGHLFLWYPPSTNGNLTNYNELAKNITSKESRYLNTNSDTEVLLHLFAELLHDRNKHDNDKEFFDNLCSVLENIYKHVVVHILSLHWL
ncbi:MAG: hypothetical protein CM1200mP10_32930 [Candidatus Neomarinimicrobiota bacterium]|nr:MAG: hypothetical protein CM1200mP10_32930 [Candidatus Neomarinimicrobiota bacterium]